MKKPKVIIDIYSGLPPQVDLATFDKVPRRDFEKNLVVPVTPPVATPTVPHKAPVDFAKTAVPKNLNHADFID